ncbi:MAG: SRPBCC family protein [Deltaproteobacteria bacterium]|nr:SRPBCC family protein [Deltaproteobacteria bacterium]
MDVLVRSRSRSTATRPRARPGDRATHLARIERELLGKALRDLDHRRQGLTHRGRSLFARDVATDAVVAERIRATLGRYSSHPRSLDVTVHEGVATLGGPILSREVERLLAAVAEVPGVRRVDDRLDRHEQPGNVPGLQGRGLHVPRRRQLLRGEAWMPGIRMLAGSLGAAAGLVGIARRGPLGGALALGGGLLTLRAFANRPLRSLFSQTHDEQGALRLHKIVTIDAPIETAYAYFRNFENFARFMDHVEEVRAQNAHSTWKVRGPVGKSVDFDVEIVRDQPNRLIAWRTLPGHGFEHAGVARFSTEGAGTRLAIELRYSVPGGSLGNLVATLFRTDPKRVLDDDLLRFKSLLEHGKTHAHRHPVTRDELRPV